MTQSLDATFHSDAAGVQAADDGELASLVRRWMTAGRQERLRRDTVLRVAPPVEDVEPVLEAEADLQVEVEVEVDAPQAALEADVEHDAVAETEVVAEAPVDAPTAPAAPSLQAPAPRTPPLPYRPTAEETEHARRIAVLIDARRVDDDVAAGLLSRLGERGTVNVCRAYADWSRSDLGAWVGRMRRQGLHSFHQFADDDEQALVAMAIDAVDIARDAAIDEIVIVGDMTSMLPLVHRLHAAGVRVVVVGPGHTPHDVRGACDEFIDTALVSTHEIAPVGRHRA
ncbi:NYN domain-containing protein [Nocardioides exalbidus]|uniref:NYN domain-containing protein n=1 Tax=Nocardioides exalbidus TaxID=402596 RepID=A0A1H4KS66_9ACTN|nr:NYN domain-containing protein [Nocardioides exalbidus]SEB61379.1 NYN domain-containing protein [Nocardioides exalbidus]